MMNARNWLTGLTLVAATATALAEADPSKPAWIPREKGLYRSQVHRGGGGKYPDNALETFLWCWGKGCTPEADVNITDEVEDKLKALSCHRSQLSYMADFGKDEFIERNRIIPAFYGIQAGCKYAEGFKAFRISGYMPDYRVLP